MHRGASNARSVEVVEGRHVAVQFAKFLDPLVKRVQLSFDSRHEGCGLWEGAEKKQGLVEADERFGVAELVTGELIEPDLYFCGCASAETALSGFEPGQQRVEGWRHVDSGCSV